MIKYIAVTIAIIIISLLLLFSLTVEAIEIGGSCGTYHQSEDLYNDEGCSCLGKLIEINKSGRFVHYGCKGIKLYHGYE